MRQLGANGLTRQIGFDSYDMPTAIQLLNGNTTTDEVDYTFNGINGTLTRRNDLTNGRDETFGYDNLLRLTGGSLNGTAAQTQAGADL